MKRTIITLTFVLSLLLGFVLWHAEGGARAASAPVTVNSAARATDDPSAGGASDPTNFMVTCTANPVVVNTNDSGAGSLRQAILDACAGSTITFAANVNGTITLTSGDLIIDKNLTIQGPGANLLTISGNQQWRIFTLFNTTPASLSLSGLSLRNGNGQSTVSFNQGLGGAVYFIGTPGNALTLTDLTIGDSASDIGGGVYAGGNTSTITVLRSTIARGVAIQGGGLALEGNSLTVNLMSSTFSGNTASSTGGGIALRTDGTVNVINSTIAGNQASNGQGGGLGIPLNAKVYVNLVNSTLTNNQGGGFQLLGIATANVRNTLLALNGGGDAQIFGGTFISSGYNLFGTGVPAGAAQATDQVGVDPLLELDGNGKPKLAFNGGPTQTIRLLPGSPAIDRGGATPFNEVQLILLQAGSGTYTLTFNGKTTNSLPFDATAAQIQTALNALSTIGGVGGNITVSQTVIPFFNGDKQISSVVSFGGTLAGSNQPLMTATTADGFSIDVIPVVDGGPFSAQPTDQRNFPRPVDLPGITNASGGDGSDIGAYEHQCSTITLSSLPNGSANVAYNQALNPSGGVGPYTITRTAGTLPPGLAINGNSLNGTPTTPGAFNFTLTATDAYGCASSQSYSLAINSLTSALADPIVCTGPGGVVAVTATVTNGQGTPQATSFTANLPASLLALPGTCSANVAGTCLVVNASTVTWAGTLNVGQTVTITYQAQIADFVTSGTQVCVTSTATIAGNPIGSVTACTTVNCAPPGPGGIFPAASEASAQSAGSVLIYNIYTSGATSGNTQNTRVNLTNIHPTRPAFVHLFFVAEGCSVADSYVCLTGNQTTSFLASDLDPGVSGYLVAVAVDGVRGCPTNFNYLIGDEYVKFATGHAANLGAEAISALAGGLPACDGNSVTAQLDFNGIAYDKVSHVLALDNVGSKADGNDTLLILNRIGGNLGTGAGSLSSVFGIFYDDAENALSFTFSGGHQFRSSLSSNFPRITPRFETYIPAGRTGWFKLWPTTSGLWGMTGAAINFNANAASSSGAFNQGHNLHKLTLTNTASYIIPVFPPSC